MADGKRALLDDDDDDDAEESEKPQQLGYNKQYAARFAHNKMREDLHRLQELQKEGLAGQGLDEDDESSTSEEEDDDGLLPARTEEKIFETLTRIKKRDPIIYSEDTTFFRDDDEEDEDEDEDESKRNAAKLKKQKPLYLKDVNARQLLEGGDEDDDFRKPKKPASSYLSEQDELKRAFLEGVREAEGGGEDTAEDNLLRVKKRTKEELEKEAKEVEEAVEEAEQRAKDKNIARRLEEYFGKDDDLNDNDKFLKEYLLNKGWIDVDQQQPKYPTYHDDAEAISEDEEVLDKQDQFEKDYNFRFQDAVDNTYVKGHSRIIDDSVRKKSEARKKQREKKKERESDAALARREELKRLKNVKKKEVLEKLAKIRAVAGVNVDTKGGGVDVLGTDDLDEDFDPEEYDKKMKEAFGEEYYGAEDPDFVDGDDEDVDELEKPDFDAEDELLGIAPERNGPSAGFAAVKAKLERKKELKVPVDPYSVDGDEEIVDEFEKPGFDSENELSGIAPEGNEPRASSAAAKAESDPKKKMKKLKVPFEEKLLIDKHLEEYYKLDYEDIVGDLQTRFKYRPVKPNKYGLKTKDIIGLEDKELNQFVSLKKLAPYTTEEWKPRRPAPRLSSKARRKKALSSDDTPKKKGKASIAVDDNVAKSGDTPKKKRKASIADNVANSRATPKMKKTSATVVDDDKATETVLNGEQANGEPLPSENGAGGEKAKKSRKRKKRGAPSPLPMSRLLSYAPPQSGKKKSRAKLRAAQ